jgi:hypothetical protein
MMSVISSRYKILFKYFFFAVMMFLFWSSSCSKKGGQSGVDRTRSSFEADYAANMLKFLESKSPTAVDSLRFMESAYYLASLDDQLYRLQNLLIKAYFDACHRKCENKKCFPGNIINAAIAYYLDGGLDSALYLCGLLSSKDKSTPLEVSEIRRIIEYLCSHKDIAQLRQWAGNGDIKTPSARGFLAIAALDLKDDPAFWQKNIRHSAGSAKSDPLVYAFAYAQARAGDIVGAWKKLPGYTPFDTAYPPPSFTENIMIGDSVLTQKIYLPFELYIRKEIDRQFFSRLLEASYGGQNRANRDALEILAEIKQIIDSDVIIERPAADYSGKNPLSFMDELRFALNESASAKPDPASVLNRLQNPISRTAFLKILTAGNAPKNLKPSIDSLITAEISMLKTGADNLSEKIYWQSCVFLSEAMLNVYDPMNAYDRMNNFGRLDLSIRNNSPEWLAIFARTGMTEGSDISLVTLIAYNLARYYPYTIGLYEIMQNYKLLCKYY